MGGRALREPIADDPAQPPDLGTRITVRSTVVRAEATAAAALADAAAAADGVFPLSEDALLHLRHGGAAATNLFLWDGRDLSGFAHLGPPSPAGARSGELVVHPARRGQGRGGSLLRAVVAQAAGAPVLLWAHGDLTAAARLATAQGFARSRVLWQMRRRLDAALGEPRIPAGVTVRAFIPGRDELEWLRLNARAFADHPEQGVWTRSDLDRREREPWFDPAGFFLAERDGRMVGFHWTKVHPTAGAPVGEVYVLGVDPGARGGGLATALTLIGLRHLRELGAPEVMLYVDESNAAAIRLYGSLGFIRAGLDVMYRRG